MRYAGATPPDSPPAKDAAIAMIDPTLPKVGRRTLVAGTAGLLAAPSLWIKEIGRAHV